MLIDENLSWKYHIVHFASKTSKTIKIIVICLNLAIVPIIGIIARLRHVVPLATLNHIYISLIQPYLLYGIVAWGRAARIHSNKIILILQKHFLRLMYFGKYKSHAVP